MSRGVLLIAFAAALMPTALSAAGEPAPKAANSLAAERASASAYTLVLTSEPGFANSIRVSREGNQWVLKLNGDSPAGEPCVNPGGNLREVRCPVSQFNGFRFSTLDGNDTVIVAATVTATVEMNGGPGVDDLVGGASGDKLVGGGGNDKLIGRAGPDYLFGNAGNDVLIGNGGKDTLRGGTGQDQLRPGPGRDDVRQ